MAILVSAPGELTTRRSSRRESTSAAMHLRCPRQELRCDLRMESGVYRMARSLIPRSSWLDSLSWNSLLLTPPSNGPRDAPEPRSAQLKSGRWRLKPSGGDSQDERVSQQIRNRTYRKILPVRGD